MKNKKGFTLIELLVVIAIIGLLSSLAVVSLNNARNKAQDARIKSDLKQVSTAMELFYSEDSRYPTSYTGGEACGDGMSVVVGNENEVMAEAKNNAALDPMCCGTGTALVTSTGQTILNAIPCHPQAAAGQQYNYEGNDNTYCISGALPQEAANFICALGSCFVDATAQCAVDL